MFAPTDHPASPSRIIVGLGNPGDEYDGTRHNLGFVVVDRLAETLGVRFERQERTRGLGPVKARVASGSVRDAAGEAARYLLVKPWTYMNVSGAAVAAYARFFGLAPDSIFVILDDLNLPLGRIRIRPGGSPGGHNGMRSLIDYLGSEGFPRLRLGIAVSELGTADMADPDFVLGGFCEEELEALAPGIDGAVAASRAWLAGTPIGTLMSSFNGQPRNPPSDSGPTEQQPDSTDGADGT